MVLNWWQSFVTAIELAAMPRGHRR